MQSRGRLNQDLQVVHVRMAVQDDDHHPEESVVELEDFIAILSLEFCIFIVPEKDECQVDYHGNVGCNTFCVWRFDGAHLERHREVQEGKQIDGFRNAIMPLLCID